MRIIFILSTLFLYCSTLHGQQISSTDTACSARLQAATSFQQSQKFQEEYQAYKGYIDNCPNDYQSWRAFGSMTGANTYRQPDTAGKSLEFRTWLKNVLYYNTQDPMYYCEDIIAIHYSYLGFNRADGADVNAAAAVLKFIVDSTSCDYADSMIIAHLQYRRQSQYEIWQDTVKDSLQTPFDTISVPTIDELDLTIIRQNQGAVKDDAIKGLSIISLTGSPNPFSNEILVAYKLVENVIANIEIYDILGREVYRSNRVLRESGDHVEKISTNTWQEGTYFIRISSSTGENQTTKIVLQR